MWTPSFGELIVIFMIILLLFGGKKLPDLARSIGNGINEFKKGLSGAVDTTTSQPYTPEKDITEQARTTNYLPEPAPKTKIKKTVTKAKAKKPVKTASKAGKGKSRKA